MIKFFRKIRQNLLEQGKTVIYLKYAIGEIVLVVIGILIALQINNLNDVQKDKRQEVQLLQSLESEFQKNLIRFDSTFKFHVQKEDYIRKLIGYKKHAIPFHTLDTLLEVISYSWTINLAGVIYKSSVNSGKIELISNYKLKNKIASFEDLFSDFQEEEQIAQEITFNQVLPILNDNITVRYPFGERNAIELKKDSVAYVELIADDKFRNRLITLKGVCWDITTEGKTVREEIVSILDEINSELENK